MGSVAITLLLDEKGFTPALEKAGAAGDNFKRKMADAGHGTITSMQAASASIRLLEGDITRNVRAVEKFITTIPGVGAALKAAFPVVGALAFAGVIFRVGEEIAKTVHELGQIRNVANESFGQLVAASQKNADSLRVANDKLEEQIALMEHKPVNAMATALDEARVRADELASSLERDYQEFKKVIEKSQEGTLNKILGGGVDKSLGNDMKDQLANIRTLGQQIKDAQRDVPHLGDKPTASENATYAAAQAKVEDLQGKLRAAQNASLKFAADQAKTRSGSVDIAGPIPVGMPGRISYAQANGDQGLNFDALNAFKNVVGDQEDIADQGQRNIGDQKQEAKDREAQKMKEAAEKAQEALLRTMEEGIAKQKAMYGVSIADELAYWSSRTSAFTRGSTQYHTVEMKEYQLQADLLRQLQEGKKKYLESQKGTVEGNDILGAGADAFRKIDVAQYEAVVKAGERYNQIVNEGNIAQEKAATVFAEMSINMALAQGTISKLDAAQALAAIHADDHAKALQRVNEELKTQIGLINSDSKLTDAEKGYAVNEVTGKAANQSGAINAEYSKQNAQDSAGISSDTIAGAARNSLNEMVQSFTDMADHLKTAIPQLIGGLNDNLTKLATGQYRKGDVGRTLLQSGQGLVKTGIQGAEGMALRALGLGGAVKRDGSSEMAALWVQVARGTATIAGMGTSSPSVSATVGGLASLIPGGSFIQPFIKPLMGLLPHFASGGDFMGGNAMVVGERGPELMVPRSSGSVIPNHMLGGGDTHMHFNIQGNQDPMAVRAAITAAAPAISAHAVQATRSMAKRMPSGR